MSDWCRIDIRLSGHHTEILDDMVRELYYNKLIDKASRAHAISWLLENQKKRGKEKSK